jgi:hypothetical protein
LNGQNIIRTSSGFTSETIKNDPKYQKSRNAAVEFGNMCSMCKSIRVSLADVLPTSNKKNVMNSFNKVMRQVMAHDLISPHGERNLANALQAEAGRNVLHGYEFNPDTKLSFNYELNEDAITTSTDTINFPGTADSIGFRVWVLAFDFETRAGQTNAGQWQFFDKDLLPNPISLLVPGIGSLSGILFTLLEVQFYNANNAVADDRSKSIRIITIRY